MGQVFLLGAQKAYDRDKEVVKVGQIIQMEGYNFPRYVVVEIIRTKWGVQYKSIDLETYEYRNHDLILPSSEKFGIGIYYDDVNPQFIDAFELPILKQKADALKEQEEQEQKIKKAEYEQRTIIGRERLEKLIPHDAVALIIANLEQDESDSQTDYFGSRTVREVILGYSFSKRNNFNEMRKCAENFEGTKHLAEYCKEYEHRETWSMGGGYFLGVRRDRGWQIRKEVATLENLIKRYAPCAGDEDNVHLKPMITRQTTEPIEVEAVQIVDYSEKAVAVIGETKPIKEELKSLGGRFNFRLTVEGEKVAGWVFPKSKKEELQTLLNR